MANTLQEQIRITKEEIDKKENRLKELIQKQKEYDRKTRTKRLIDRGAILESLLNGVEMLTNEQLTAFLKKTVGSPFGAKLFEEAKAKSGHTPAPQAEVSQEDGG